MLCCANIEHPRFLQSRYVALSDTLCISQNEKTTWPNSQGEASPKMRLPGTLETISLYLFYYSYSHLCIPSIKCIWFHWNCESDVWIWNEKNLCRVFVQGPGPSARYAHTLALVCNRWLVATGGNDGKKTLDDAWSLDTADKPYQWQKLEPTGEIPPPRWYLLAINHKRKWCIFNDSSQYYHPPYLSPVHVTFSHDQILFYDKLVNQVVRLSWNSIFLYHDSAEGCHSS